MWKISKPTITALDSFDTCRAGVTDPVLTQALESARPRIRAAERAYDAAALAGTAHLIPSATRVGTVTKTQMADLYDRHMARAKSRGRVNYDKLMLAAVNDTCPFCGHLPVSTLDHTLPKKQHPALAVTPINLIPCCKDCNHSKGTSLPTTANTQWMNAYYDDVTADRWLYAEIVPSSPPGAKFFVDPAAGWDPVTTARVNNHFDELELAKLYASQAGRSLQNTRAALRKIYAAAGAVGVSDDLQLRAESIAEVTVNSWEGALFEAAAANDWYCDGGFNN